MPKRATDGSIKLKFPISTKGLAGKKDTRYSAAAFIVETYRLNPQTNVSAEEAAIKEGWKIFALSTRSRSVDDMMAELQTPRIMRLWADLWLQQAKYTAPLRSRHMPLRQRVSWMAGDVQKVAVLFDHPGLVIWVPFYGDMHLKDLKYSYMADGIRTLNPELSMTPHIAESILTHIIWNDFSAVSDDVLGSAVDREIERGRNALRGSLYEPLFFTDEDDMPLTTVMIIPEVANSYEEFNTACHYRNPRSSITREQVYEAYRWLLTLKLGLSGYPLVKALKGALPADMDQYHDAVKAFGLASSEHIKKGKGPPSTKPDQRLFAIRHQCHRMLKITATGTVLPLARLPIRRPPPKNPRRIRSGRPSQVGEVWMEMLKAPVTSAAAASQAALDEPVAVKVEVED